MTPTKSMFGSPRLSKYPRSLSLPYSRLPAVPDPPPAMLRPHPSRRRSAYGPQLCAASAALLLLLSLFVLHSRLSSSPFPLGLGLHSVLPRRLDQSSSDPSPLFDDANNDAFDGAGDDRIAELDVLDEDEDQKRRHSAEEDEILRAVGAGAGLDDDGDSDETDLPRTPRSGLFWDHALGVARQSFGKPDPRRPYYVLFTASAAMLSLGAFFPSHIATKTTAGVGDVDVPGLWTVPKASLPLPLHNQNHLFTTQFVENCQILQKAGGILINTFHALEQEALDALNGGKVVAGLPPVIAIGPLKPVSCEGGSPLPWLDAQPARSVVYVSFGSRTAMSVDQMKELGIGLEKSGCSFLWVVKSKVVDREEEAELDELLGEEYLERVKERGLVVKGWVEQEEILRHRAVGGFVSHCGWNSMTEAALDGVPILAWPRIGDQRVNAGVISRGGLGIWVDEWSWEGEEKVVMAEEIGERVRELMEDDGLRASTARLGEEAAKAAAVDGSSGKALAEFIGKL